MPRILGSCAFGLLVLLGVSAGSMAADPADSEKIHWYNDLQAAYQVSVESDKPMLLVFHADWCRYCTKLEQRLQEHRAMVAYINASFVPVHLDVDRDPEIADILEIESLPSTVVLSPQADLIGRLVGYAGVEKFQETLQQARGLQARIRQAEQRAALAENR